MDWHHGEGIVAYDPFRGSMKKDTSGWCIVNIDKEITRYNRWWLQREKHTMLNEPAWNAHISIIRGERVLPQYVKTWKKHQGRKVQFKYQHGDIQVSKDKDQPGWFYWIRVDCPAVDEIRNELGLITSWQYHHATIGRTYY